MNKEKIVLNVQNDLAKAGYKLSEEQSSVFLGLLSFNLDVFINNKTLELRHEAYHNIDLACKEAKQELEDKGKLAAVEAIDTVIEVIQSYADKPFDLMV